MRLAVLPPLLLALALVGTGAADHCESWSSTEADAQTCEAGASPCYYVSIDFCQPDCHILVWVYEESNGLEGLQRGDEVVDDTCHEMVRPDTIIF